MKVAQHLQRIRLRPISPQSECRTLNWWVICNLKVWSLILVFLDSHELPLSWSLVVVLRVHMPLQPWLEKVSKRQSLKQPNFLGKGGAIGQLFHAKAHKDTTSAKACSPL